MIEQLLLVGEKVRLRPKDIRDAVNDYAWRRDPELCRLDAALPITCSFKEFLEEYVYELQHHTPGQRFAIETLEGEHIGNCGYFNVDVGRREAEIGIMIGNRAYWNRGYGTDAIVTLLKYIFSHTNLNRVFLKTLDWNLRAQKCFAKCGFVPCGSLVCWGYSFLVMETFRPYKASTTDKIQKMGTGDG